MKKHLKIIIIFVVTFLSSILYNLITGKSGFIYGTFMKLAVNTLHGWKEVNVDKSDKDTIDYMNLPPEVKNTFFHYKANINKPDGQRSYVETNLTDYKIRYRNVGFLQGSYAQFYMEGTSMIAIIEGELKIKKEFGGILVFYEKYLFYPEPIVNSQLYYRIDLSEYLTEISRK